MSILKFLKPTHRRQHQKDPFIIPDINDKTANLKRTNTSNWIDDGFDEPNNLFSRFNKNKKSINEKRAKYISLAITTKKSLIIGGLIILGLLTMFLRVSYLQLIRGNYYYYLAEGNRIRLNYLKSPRGIIYDRYNKPLVKNIPTFNLVFYPADLPKDKQELIKIINQLAKIVDLNPEEIINQLADIPNYSLQSITIKKNIDYEQAILLKIITEEMPGVSLETMTRRQYLVDSLSLSHILGYEGKITQKELERYGEDYLFNDYLGKTGIEAFYERTLRGHYGREEIEVDAWGRKIKLLATDPRQLGQSIILTIDLELQTQAEKILRNTLRATDNQKGAVVVMNPNNGEILSLVSWPSFNSNDFSQGISIKKYQTLIDNPNQPLFNRVISGEYPSGSTFKLIVAASALAEGIIDNNTSFNSVGGLQIKSWFYPDWKAGGHGWTNITKALAESVNTFFYYIGGGYENFKGLGVEKIVHYAQLFGLGQETGIDLINERPGFLPSTKWKEMVKGESWYIGDTYHLAIGQGDILVTPLQVANFTTAFANQGTLWQPHLVKSIIDTDSGMVKNIQPKIINQNFIDGNNLQQVLYGLRQAVTSGSAKALTSLPIEVAGKTGTAQWGTDKTPHAWFTGFAPYKNPELVVTVLIEEGGEGSVTALSVAKQIWQWHFSRNL